MAFPTIPTAGAGRVLTTTTTGVGQTRTFPSLSSLTKNAGDLLIAIVVAYQSSTTDAQFGSWGASFTEFHDTGTSTTMAIGIAYKWSTGSETGTFTVTQSNNITGTAAMILLSIPGAHASTPPEAGSRVSGTSSAANPGSFNPGGWDAEDTLWLAVGASGATSASGTYTGLGADPADFTDPVETGISADAGGGVEGGVSFRQLNAASIDVGTWTVDTSNARNAAVVVAIRPAPAPPNEGSASGSIAWSGAVTGTTVRSGSASGSIAWSGVVDGEAPPETTEGSASGAIDWAGTVTGTTVRSGAASGAIGWAGSVTGEKAPAGGAIGSVSWVGVVDGTTLRSGAAIGSIGWAGVVAGRTIMSSAIAASIDWEGIVTGEIIVSSLVEGDINWVGVVTGEKRPAGAVTGSISWAGAAFGVQQPTEPGGDTFLGDLLW